MSRRSGGSATGTRAVTKQERVYQAIRERIFSGAYAPDDRLSMDAIADEFNVSRLPVREALVRLGAEGLVIHRVNASARVAAANPEQYAADLTVSALLEGYATALAAPRLGADDIEQLEALNQRLADAVATLDRADFVSLDEEFHETIYARCPNALTIRLIRSTARRLEAIRSYAAWNMPYRGPASVAEHDELIALIAGGAPADEIEARARAHKLRGLANLRDWGGERT